MMAGYIRGKVATLATVLITNNLSGYSTGYKFFKVATSLIANDLSGYIRQANPLLTLISYRFLQRP
jgi:hypothetical protein